MRLLLLISLLFFAAVAQAQDVTIPAPVAAFFLERNEEAKILQTEVGTLTQDVVLLEKLDSIRQVELVIAHQQTAVYDSLVKLKEDELQVCTQSEAILEKSLKKERHKTVLVGIGAVILVILSFIQ